MPLVALALTAPVSADSTTPLDSPQFTWLGEEFVKFGDQDLGTTISARVTVTALGAPKLTYMIPGVVITKTGAPLPGTPGAEAASLTVTKKPGIKGKPVVGKVLKAKPPKFAQSGVKLKYKWLANGKAIKKATGKSLKLAKKLKGKRIQVRVTATKAGFKKTVVTSKKTKRVTSP